MGVPAGRGGGQIILTKKLQKQRERTSKLDCKLFQAREANFWSVAPMLTSEVWEVVSVQTELNPFFEQMVSKHSLKVKLKSQQT